MTASLDTNCLLQWLLEEIPEQAEKVSGLLESKGTFHIADPVLIEVIFVLEKVKRINRALIQQTIQVIFTQSNIKCNRALFEEALELYTAHPKLSFVDCYLAIYAKITSTIPLYTFDRKLAAQLPQAALL
jgi:predicted nucleic-acid-binding protein